MATYQVDLEGDLKIPLKVKAAQEKTTVKAWVSALVRAALEEQERQTENRKSAA